MTDPGKQQTQGTQEIELNVSGMRCQGCEQALSIALKQHETVESAQADVSSGTVRVRVRGDVDLAELKDRVRAAGYETA